MEMTEDEEDYGVLLIFAGLAGEDLLKALYRSYHWPWCGEIGWLKRGESGEVYQQDRRHCEHCEMETTQTFHRVNNSFLPEWQRHHCGQVVRTVVVIDEQTMEGER